jgi:hypothetical protein
MKNFFVGLAAVVIFLLAANGIEALFVGRELQPVHAVSAPASYTAASQDVSPKLSGDGDAGIVLAVMLFLAGALFYLLPTLTASMRGVKSPGVIYGLNILLGWTLVGWIVALVLAFSAETENQAKSKEIDYARLAAAMRAGLIPPPPPPPI